MLNKFFDPSTPSLRKVDDGEKRKERKEKENRMSFIVATNVIASRPHEHRSTGTPHARANFLYSQKSKQDIQFLHVNILTAPLF